MIQACLSNLQNRERGLVFTGTYYYKRCLCNQSIAILHFIEENIIATYIQDIQMFVEQE